MASTSRENEEAKLTFMDPSPYKAAAEGNFDAFKDNEEPLEKLLTPNKNTILHIHITAQQCGETESTQFVKMILNKCSLLLLQPNAKGETPLHMAARYGRSRTVKVLIQQAKSLHKEDLERGIEEAKKMLRMTNKENDTALHETVRFNHHQVVKLLIKEYPELSYFANDAGETPLYLAAERGFSESVTEILRTCSQAHGVTEILPTRTQAHCVTEILPPRTSPAHGGPIAKTALHAAVIRNDQEMANTIVNQMEAQITKADEKGWTPLHYAAHLGHVSMVKLLLNKDKSVAYSAQGEDKMTALHIAAGHGHRDIMKEIILRCPDSCELVDKKGWNVLHFAVKRDDDETVEFVLENSSLSNLLNEKDVDGNTPLHQLAVSLSYIPALIEHPKVDKMALNNKKQSALDISLANKNFSTLKGSIVRKLKKAGVREGWQKITYKDDSGEEKNSDTELFKKIKDAKNTHLIVATLIATVTFAAGFTMPGGYNSADKGANRGTAILTGSAAFKAFVITDTIAMVFSSSSVFMHLFLAMVADKRLIFWYFVIPYFFTIIAMGAMMVAFMTGLFAVLEQSSRPLAITICVIGSCFFLPYFCLPFRKRFEALKSN